MHFLNEFLQSFSPAQTGHLFMWVLSALAVVLLVLIVERYWDITSKVSLNAPLFIQDITALLREGNFEEAQRICRFGGQRPLPKILGAAIEKLGTFPELVVASMEEAALSVLPGLEKRLNAVAVCGNLATLLGLMGTIYGLILSFAAVAQDGIPASEKASMLATGISTAMNTTLLGLVIAIPSVLAYAFLRGRVDEAHQEIDRYTLSLLKNLNIPNVTKSYSLSSRRIKEEIDTEPNMVPFMNLMVVLIPLLLSSSEFVKLGMIEIKLPESIAEQAGEALGEGSQKDKTLDLTIVVTAQGFRLRHSFGDSDNAGDSIALVGGEYDFDALNISLQEIKRKALLEILGLVSSDIPQSAALHELYRAYISRDFSSVKHLSDHENLSIAAEETVNYQTVISVMDAARGINVQGIGVTMFPNVSIAGGVAQ